VEIFGIWCEPPEARVRASSSHIYPARESLLFRRLTGLNSASLHAAFASRTNGLISRACRKKFCCSKDIDRLVALLYGCCGGYFGPLLPVCFASLARSGMRRNQIYNKQSGGSNKDPLSPSISCLSCGTWDPVLIIIAQLEARSLFCLQICWWCSELDSRESSNTVPFARFSPVSWYFGAWGPEMPLWACGSFFVS
jgi:hypothetical protein